MKMPTILTAAILCALSSFSIAKPLKVFILAGQSNMEGPASISTFDYIGDDPATAPLLKMMRGADGKPTEAGGAWISYLTGPPNGANSELHGKLTAGYGSMWGQDPTKPGTNIGPEFTFGLAMDASLEEPVLIIKAAWGGMSLHTNFRPPSAGRYELPKATKELWPQYPEGAHGVPAEKDRPKWFADQAAAAGVQYRLMTEIAEKHDKVQQMRSALDGKNKDHANADGKMTDEQKNEFMKKYEADLISPGEATVWKRGASNFGFHYLGCAKTFALMGKAFAEANLKMMKKP